MELTTIRFDPSSHEIETVHSEGGSHVGTIDGRAYYCCDGDVPRREVVSLSLTLDDQERVPLATDGMFDPDPWKGSPQFWLARDRIEDSYLLKGQFSDAAGTYYAEWAVRNRRAVRTFIEASCGAYGEDFRLERPERDRIAVDIEAIYGAGCTIDNDAVWDIDDPGLELLIDFHCGAVEPRQAVLKYVREGGVWNYIPRSKPSAAR